MTFENRGTEEIHLVAPGIELEAEEPSEFATALADSGPVMSKDRDPLVRGVGLPVGTMAYRCFDLVLSEPQLHRLSGAVRVIWNEVSPHAPPPPLDYLGRTVPVHYRALSQCWLVDLTHSGDACALERTQDVACPDAPDLTLDVARSRVIAPP